MTLSFNVFALGIAPAATALAVFELEGLLTNRGPSPVTLATSLVALSVCVVAIAGLTAQRYNERKQQKRLTMFGQTFT